MKQLIYRSQPFGFDRPTLATLLANARRNNRRDGITGALICRHDLYLQLIEGPAPAIDALYARIAVDDRHCDVRLLASAEAGDRIFPQWEMLDDQMPSLFWPPEEVASGAAEAAGPERLVELFRRLAVHAGTSGPASSPA